MGGVLAAPTIGVMQQAQGQMMADMQQQNMQNFMFQQQVNAATDKFTTLGNAQKAMHDIIMAMLNNAKSSYSTMAAHATSSAAGSSCPAIQFSQAPIEVTFGFDSTGQTDWYLPLYRQADGNFTGQLFTIPAGASNTSLKYIGPLAQAQNYFAACYGGSSWTPKPHATLLADMPGTMSRAFLTTSLGGAAPYAWIAANGAAGDSSITVGLDSQTTLGASHTDYATGGVAASLLTADFNGDGKRDVAVLNTNPSGSGNGVVSILLGNGDGTLRAAVNYPVGASPSSMTWFDFNKDGRADLAVVNGDDSTVTVLMGNADGSMRAMGPYALPSGMNATGIVAGDFDGDGKADLAVFSPSNLVLMHGKGDGSFQAVAARPSDQLSFWAFYMAPADFNKDGKLDLASINGDGTVSVLLNAGDGSFATQLRYGAGNPITTGMLSPVMFAMDFNDDGNLDLVLANGHPDALLFAELYVTVLLGNGDGTFQSAARAYATGSGPVFGTNQGWLPNATMAMADFNGDGLRDLVVSGDGILILLGQSGGGFQAPVKTSCGGVWLAAADVNGDGRPDLITADNNGGIHTCLGNGDGTFQAPASYATGVQTDFIAAGDLNGDGRPDLILSYGDPTATSGASTSVSVVTAKAGGGYNAPSTVPTGLNTIQTVLADLNGDGKLDLIAVNAGYPAATPLVNGNVSVSLGNGDGTFKAPVSYTVGLNPTSVAVADVNGDGKPDLIVGTIGASALQIAVLPGNGNGTFGAPITEPTCAWPSTLAVADFDGDGKLDVAIVHWAGESLMSVMQGNGDGTFQPEDVLLAGDLPVAAIAADFTGDGRPDLAVLAQGFIAGGSLGLFRDLSTSAPCTYSLGASSQPFTTSGGTGSFKVNAAAGCEWTAGTSSSWITLAYPARGGNNGTVGYKVAANSGPARIATITAGGQTFTVNQAGTGPQWSIAKIHAGNFTQGQNGATYTIRVTNSGGAATSGTVTVTDNAPTGLTLVSMAGQGWTCPAGGNTCTRSDALNSGANFPDITATVNVAASAAASLTNQASVSGGGAASSGSASDSTTITPAGAGGTPLAVLVSPAAGSWASESYTFAFSDSAGWQSIHVADILINSFVDGRNACYVAVVPSSSSVYLVDDAGDAGGPYQGITLPGSGTAQNSQCSISGTGSSISGSGNTLTVTLAIAFKSAFAGNKVMYLAAGDVGGANSGWQALGTCGVPGSTPAGPAVGGVTPARSSGTGGGSFVFTFTDTNGWQDLGVVNVLINDALNGNGACYLAYSRAYNTLYLVNDAGNGLLPGLTLNGSGTLGNSQCTITGAGSSASGSSNTLTLTLNTTFSSSFAGNRIIYMAARSNGDLLNSGWQAVGSRTVQ